MAEEWSYRRAQPISREQAEAVFARGDSASVTDTLLGLAFHDPDWRWVQDHCLGFSAHPDYQLRAVSVLCLEHVARIHGQLDLGKVLPILRKLSEDENPWVRSNVEDALTQISESIYGLRSHYVREHDRLEYVLPMSREEAEAALDRDNPGRTRAALHALIQYDPDWRRTQGSCLRLIGHPDIAVRKDAVECFDWLVSMHEDLDTELVLPVLEGLVEDPEVGEEARQTLRSIKEVLGGKEHPTS